MFAGLRRIPAPLLAAQVAAVTVGLYGVVHGLLASFDGFADRTDSTTATLLAGSRFASAVLAVVGLAWLTRRLSGNARVGARIALVAAVLILVTHVAWLAISFFELLTGSLGDSTLWHVGSVMNSAGALLFAVGLGIAARRWYLIVGGGVVAVLTNPPWFIARLMFESVESSFRVNVVLYNGLELTSALAMLVLVVYACREALPSSEAPRVASGLSRFTYAMYGQTVATIAVVAFTLLLNGYDAGGSALFAYQIAIVLATALGLGCLIVLALGALDTVRGSSELPAWLLVASSVAALCVAGRTLMRVVDLAQRYFVHQNGWERGGLAFPTQEPPLTSAISVQLLSTFAIVGVLVAVAIAARRRGLEAVRARTMLNTGIVVALTLGAITAQQVIVTTSELTPFGAVAMLGANVALVVSWLIAAGVAKRAMNALAAGSNLPAAKLVRR